LKYRSVAAIDHVLGAGEMAESCVRLWARKARVHLHFESVRSIARSIWPRAAAAKRFVSVIASFECADVDVVIGCDEQR